MDMFRLNDDTVVLHRNPRAHHTQQFAHGRHVHYSRHVRDDALTAEQTGRKDRQGSIFRAADFHRPF